MEHKGFLALVLHAHLPYVRHPDYDHYLEEDWFFEALTETYIPLLNVFEGLTDDGIPWELTMSLTPPLLSMFLDPFLHGRYNKHMERLMELADREVERTRYQPQFHPLALMYREHFYKTYHHFNDKYKRNLAAAFGKFQELGHLEIIASAATHGYLPLMDVHPPAVRAQIALGVQFYRQLFHRDPQGFWLPECGYQPGHDAYLREFGIKYSFTDSHGVLHAEPKPKYAVYAPIYSPEGLALFARDWESSKQVWSADEGYPGDYVYREFYRDIGYDLDYDYIGPYLKDGIRVNTGIKYYRVTGKGAHREPYDPHVARERAAQHAGNFMFNREKQIEYLRTHMDRPPIVVAPYDAELFGHWWFEGVDWLNFLIRKLAFDQKTVALITPSRYLEQFPKNQICKPHLSSWGYKGYSEVWLEGSNHWIYPHLHMAAQRMIQLAREHPYPDDLTRRALNQAARELLLAQSSDWAFIMKTGTMVEYATRRTKDHIGRFNLLYEQIRHNSIDESFLADLEWRDNIFPHLDYRIYSEETASIAVHS
ncbi:MAG: glycoside hydrolase family 57 protein [Limnochordia bacterium]